MSTILIQEKALKAAVIMEESLIRRAVVLTKIQQTKAKTFNTRQVAILQIFPTLKRVDLQLASL